MLWLGDICDMWNIAPQPDWGISNEIESNTGKYQLYLISGPKTDCFAFAVALDVVPCVISEKVQIAPSEHTNGLGVFVAPGEEVRPGDIITEYPGTWTWVAASELRTRMRGNMYAFVLGPTFFERRKYFAVLDGKDEPRDKPPVCGHLLNTCHPTNPHPWKLANCIFAVYIDELVLSLDVAPRVRVFIQSVRSMRGVSPVTSGNELLLDYHWQLASVRGLWCENVRCRACVEACHDYFADLLTNFK